MTSELIDSEPVIDVLQDELGQNVRADVENEFYIITTEQFVVNSSGEIFARCEGVNGHNTGKKIGKFDTGKEVANKIRELAGDDV